MRFGDVPIKQALGALVAHAVVLPDRRLKKGHLLTEGDLIDLQAAGVTQITVARLDVGDVEENAAAVQIATALASDEIDPAEAFTGRVNLYAKATGLFQADAHWVDAFNQISPDMTLASLANDTFVEAGRMVATVKIIPFAVDRGLLSQAVALLTANPVLSIAPARSLQVALIATQLPALKPATMDKTRRVLADRLAPSGSTIVGETRVDHRAGAVAQAISDVLGGCDMIVVFGASAITDIGDVIPEGIRQAGGEVSYFGMPVDPGNLLLTGRHGKTPIIGAPGCARSPAENGFDWVLQRLLCDRAVDASYISRLGVGGLLMEIHARPQPREG